jgi:hypothetical protein
MVTYDQQSSRSGRYLGGRTVDRSPSKESIGDTTGKTSWGTLIEDELKMPDADTIDSRDAQRQPLDAESSSGLPTPPTIGEPPRAPTNNSQFQWRKYQQRLAVWQVEKKAQVEQYELDRNAAMDQKRATIQGRQFEIQEADRIAQIQSADIESKNKEKDEMEVLNAMQEIQDIDGTSDDYDNQVIALAIKYPSAIGDARVKSIISRQDNRRDVVLAAKKAEDEKRKAEEEKGVALTEKASREVLEARKVAAAEGFTPDEIKEVFRDGGVDQVALARAQRAAKQRTTREGKAETDQFRKDYSLSRLEEDKVALEAQAEVNPDDPKIQADIAAIDERIRFRKKRQEEAEVAPTSSEAISVDEAKRLHAQGKLAPGTLIKMNDGTIRPYVGK